MKLEKVECLYCKNSFSINSSRRSNTAKFCSRDCRHQWHNSENAFKNKILSSIDIDESTTCWNWNKAVSIYGYGKFGLNGKHWRAHRLSYEIFVGEIPEESLVLHNCDNRKCVNPKHLYLGDYYQNAQDIKTRNRTHLIRDPKIGSKNPKSKLNENIVIEIRKQLKSGVSGKDISLKYCVSTTTISEIKSRKIWSHV